MKITLSYWKRYDRLFKNCSYKVLFDKVKEIAIMLGEPFSKTSNRGPKFKIPPVDYASYIVFEVITGNNPYRDMELGSELYVGKHIDHSTFGKNFQRVPYKYLVKLLEKCAELLERILGSATAYIPDSTGVATNMQYDTIIAGKEAKKTVYYKLHSLVGYYPDKGITYIKTGIGTDIHISDAGGAVTMLDSYNNGWAYFPADSGYDFNIVYKAAFNKNLTPIIKQRDYRSSKHSKWRIKGIGYFKKNIYDELRHVVETIFGGLENKGLLKTKLRRADLVNKFSIIVQLCHNIRVLLSLSIVLLKYYSTNSRACRICRLLFVTLM